MKDISPIRSAAWGQSVGNVESSIAAVHLRALTEMGRGLDPGADPATLATQVVSQLRDRFGYQYVALILLDDTGESLYLGATSWGGRDAAVGQPGRSLPPGTLGVPEWVAVHGEPVFIQDAHSDARYRSHSLLPEAASEIAVPLVAASHPLGVLDVRGDAQGGLTQTDLLILQVVADRVAIAIENARFRAQITQLLDQTRRRLDELSTLYAIGNEIVGSLALDKVLDAIVNAVRQALNCRGCCIFLLDDSGQVLEIRAAAGLKPEWRQAARLALGEGIAGRAAASLQPVYVPDTHTCPGFVFFDHEVRCLLAVPLQVQGRVIGVLNIDDSVPDAFGAAQERLLTIAASQVAVAIDNARLFSQVLAEKQRKEEFLAIVTHELRTPLSCIRGLVSLMLDDQVPETQTQREFLEIVQRQSERLTLLVNNLLNVSRLDEVELHLRCRPLQVADVVRNAVLKFHGLADEKRIALDTSLAHDLPTVSGDQDRLEQVITNLLDNAISVTPEHGHVAVVARPLENDVLVEVRDTGIGIPAASVDHLFAKFYRVPDEDNARPRGTGLGLYISRKIVEAHGGRIWAESTPGRGSVFRFLLPGL